MMCPDLVLTHHLILWTHQGARPQAESNNRSGGPCTTCACCRISSRHLLPSHIQEQSRHSPCKPIQLSTPPRRETAPPPVCIHQHMSVAKTPLQHIADARHRRYGRCNTAPPIVPYSQHLLQDDAPKREDAPEGLVIARSENPRSRVLSGVAGMRRTIDEAFDQETTRKTLPSSTVIKVHMVLFGIHVTVN